ncbi:MAG TPA: flavodoxin family protein [Syntrophorhabdaceae bacterium]|nr:flavodoxin family protein [Syntrophorhabdaceae bacterium]
MKIVALIGSPKGIKGNTAALLKVVLEGAESKGAETETIAIRGGEIKPCLGCDTCHRVGVCPQKDEFNAVKAKIIKAEGLILASPNYIFHVSAQLKAFIDRCCGVVHCQSFEGKYGASVVTSGGGDEQPIADYLNHFLVTTGAIPVGSVCATMGRLQGQDFPHDLRKGAYALGEKLVAAWKNKETKGEYESTSVKFQERMRSLMIWRKQEWPYEYEYWKKHRFLNDSEKG